MYQAERSGLEAVTHAGCRSRRWWLSVMVRKRKRWLLVLASATKHRAPCCANPGRSLSRSKCRTGDMVCEQGTWMSWACCWHHTAQPDTLGRRVVTSHIGPRSWGTCRFSLLYPALPTSQRKYVEARWQLDDLPELQLALGVEVCGKEKGEGTSSRVLFQEVPRGQQCPLMLSATVEPLMFRASRRFDPTSGMAVEHG